MAGLGWAGWAGYGCRLSPWLVWAGRLGIWGWLGWLRTNLIGLPGLCGGAAYVRTNDGCPVLSGAVSMGGLCCFVLAGLASADWVSGQAGLARAIAMAGLAKTVAKPGLGCRHEQFSSPPAPRHGEDVRRPPPESRDPRSALAAVPPRPQSPNQHSFPPTPRNGEPPRPPLRSDRAPAAKTAPTHTRPRH